MTQGWVAMVCLMVSCAATKDGGKQLDPRSSVLSREEYTTLGQLGGRALCLNPDGTYLLQLFACAGLAESCVGTYEISSEKSLILSCGVPCKINHDKECILVVWGDRKYVVQKSEMTDFVNSVNVGWEPRTDKGGMFLLYAANLSEPPHGPLSLPADHYRFLEGDVIGGSVVGVVEGEDSSPEAVIGVGSNDGVFKGMWLFVENGGPMIVVSHVEPKWCVASEQTPRTGDGFVKIGARVFSRIVEDQ